jgi:hypothetical protein
MENRPARIWKGAFVAAWTVHAVACSSSHRGSGDVPADAGDAIGVVDAGDAGGSDAAPIDTRPPQARPQGPAAEYCVDRERALLDYHARCWPHTWRDELTADPETVNPSCWQAAPLAISSGQIAFDAARAASCLEYIEGAPCVEPFALDLAGTVCAEVFTPLLNHGEACYTDLDRALHASPCIDGFCAVDACPGHCEPLRKLDEPCSFYEPCTDGLHCSPEWRCAERKPEGEPCTFDGECAAGLLCDEPSGACAPALEFGEACSEGDLCRASECLDGICQYQVASGGPCRYNTNCPAGESCFEIEADGRFACAPALEQGAPCGDMRYVCEDGLYCLDGVCAPPPGEGEVCLDIHSDGWVCGQGLRCGFYVNLEPRCYALMQEGDPCPYEDIFEGKVGDLCAPGLFCMSNGRCLPRGGEGDPCQVMPVLDSFFTENTCEAGLWCDPTEGRCRTALGAGERCARLDVYACEAGLGCLCDPSTGDCTGRSPDSLRCGPLKDLGEECFGSHECRSRSCVCPSTEGACECSPGEPYCFGPT